jgi:hypothetical protein
LWRLLSADIMKNPTGIESGLDSKIAAEPTDSEGVDK